MFFEARSGSYFPVSAIKEIRFSRKEENQRLYIADLGDINITISETEKEKITNAPLSFIPALPGTRLVDAITEPDEPMYEEVIAWAFSPSGMPFPVTASGPDAGTINPWAVIHPSGHVEEPGMVTYDNLDAYLANKRP